MIAPFLSLAIALLTIVPGTSDKTERATDPTVRNCDDPDNIYLPPSATETTERLALLRNEMQKNGYEAYIIPTEDEHLSEYIPARDQKRKWITGFTGSAGVAVVTSSKAALWTDGRYFLQAERQLDCNWLLMRKGQPGVPSLEEWISSELNNSDITAANPFVFSIASWQKYGEYLGKSNIRFAESIPDLIENVWIDRPPYEGTEISKFPVEYAGKEWTDKIADARSRMEEAGADYLLLTILEENAWLFNLRGNDLPTIPVFISYSLIGKDQRITLYANTTLLNTAELQDYLKSANCQENNVCVDIGATEDVRQDLIALPNDTIVWMSSATTTYGMYSAIPLERQIQDTSPIYIPKTVKNDVEIDGMKRAHIYDAVALCEYMLWLEENVPLGKVDEISGATKLEEFRRAQPANKGISFETISAVGVNAALIHYESSEETNRNLTVNEVYLVDSGGQYYYGTTDVTRTLHFGTPTDFEKEAFTYVLMGVINLETAIFPSNLDGGNVDILARQNLYNAGLDYRHGTGHGIGHYLNVHEYPPYIGMTPGYGFQAGMFTSDEPGYYEDGKFGIRLENILMIKKADTKYHFGDYDYLTMTPVTLVPYEKKMVDIDLLSDKQLSHINDYHARIMKEIGDEAISQGKDELHKWLSRVTTPMKRNFALRSSFGSYVLSLSVFFSFFWRV